MRRGCIASEELQCDGCHHIIPYAARYLTIDEEDGVEVEKGKLLRYCIECALQKGYASYQEEKEGKVLTFFV
ncbi:MAG: hypothetical protein HY528_02175 [Chloroflexi bacterium]|nr:hypothetical protein [Chloroflexota bacterium]